MSRHFRESIVDGDRAGGQDLERRGLHQLTQRTVHARCESGESEGGESRRRAPPQLHDRQHASPVPRDATGQIVVGGADPSHPRVAGQRRESELDLGPEGGRRDGEGRAAEDQGEGRRLAGQLPSDQL